VTDDVFILSGYMYLEVEGKNFHVGNVTYTFGVEE
jgi:hypothetical protein